VYYFTAASPIDQPGLEWGNGTNLSCQ
jgi:hypothetical protein